MLFVAYWEINPNLEPKKIAEAAAKVLEKEEFPVKGIKTIGWYITREYWGVTIFETENAEPMFKDSILWRKAVPGIFANIKVTPAMKTQDIIPLILKSEE